MAGLSQRRRRIVGRLRSRKTREREGLVLVEGVRAVREALDSGAPPRFAVLSPRLWSSEPGRALAERLAAVAGLEVAEVDDSELEELADTASPQGVLLVCPEPRADLEGLSGRRFLVLDAVQDPGNVGTLVRGAVAFGLDGVVCLDGCVDPWGAKAVRASAGLVFRLRIVTASASAMLRRMEVLDVPVWVADAQGEDVAARRGEARFALVVGNEGAGVREEIRAHAATTVAIAMNGPAESLNAGVAGSILMHTLVGR